MAKKDKKDKKKKKDKEVLPSRAKGNPNSVAAVEGVNLTTKVYDKEIAKLQVELVRLQAWVKKKKLKVSPCRFAKTTASNRV